MSRLFQAIRRHHTETRLRRELNQAIAGAATPAMRDELVLAVQRGPQLR